LEGLVLLGTAVVFAAASLIFRRLRYPRWFRKVAVLAALVLLVADYLIKEEFSWGRLVFVAVGAGVVAAGFFYVNRVDNDSADLH